MSFNVRYGSADDGENSWPRRRLQVCELVRQCDPDVIGLQEALRFQIDFMRQDLPGYGEVGEGRDGGETGEYSAILYRTARFAPAESGTFWLSDTPGEPSRHWGNACTRVCTWARLVEKRSGRAFYFYNTHLDHRSQPSRLKSVQLIGHTIAHRTHPQDPFVLTGDFNAGEDSPSIAYLTGRAEAPGPLLFVDTFRVLHPDEKLVGTFNGFSGRADGAKIDYVLTEPTAQVLESAIVRIRFDGRCASDHDPVTATLRFTPVAGPAPVED
jgi:endonuclease/exonuclease/phosphatase family metal-dependent hydrolase